MKEIKWIAGNGQEVVVREMSTMTNMADHTYQVAVDEIHFSLGGKFKIFRGWEGEDIMKMADIKIKVPADKLAEVKEMIEAKKEREAKRNAESEVVEIKYNENHKKVSDAMNQ
jgi:hypothetical protein